MNRRTFLRSTVAAAATLSMRRRRALAAAYQEVPAVPPDVEAVTGDGREVVLRGRAIQELRSRLRGRLLLAGDDGYDEARRILNPSFDKRPALIAQVTGTADVRIAVDFAKEHEGLLLAVKCGGHSASGKSTCNRGMMIDLSPCRHVRVDPVAQRARVAGGSLLAELDHEAMAYDLVTPMGTVSHTGVGGLVTAGGFGRVGRRFGLSIDNLVSADVVSADGQFRRASAEEHPDLFWGIRGGSGNFGVVTSFEFELHPMQRQVMGGLILFPIDRARDVLEMYAEYGPNAPDELDLIFTMMRPPEGGSVTSAVSPGGVTDPIAGVAVCYSGPTGEVDRVLAPIRRLGTPALDTVQAVDYVALQRSGDIDDPRARASYLKSGFVPDIQPELVSAILELQGHPARSTVVAFQPGRGAISRVANDATAFPNRGSAGNLLLGVDWAFGDEPDEHVAWIRRFWKTLEPFIQGFYSNDGDVDVYTPDSVAASYRQNHARLVEIKNRYDPTNLFRLNANIEPTV